MKALFKEKGTNHHGVVKQLQDLLETFAVSPDGFVSADNFESPLAAYDLREGRVKCQFLRDGHLCEREHGKGLVVRTKDKDIVFIGHCCALRRLDVSHEGISSRLRVFEQQARRQDKETRVQELVDNTDQKLDDIHVLSKRITASRQDLRQFTSLLPERANDALQRLAMAGRNSVEWEYETIKHDASTGTKEHTWTPVTIGALKGLNALIDVEEKQIRAELMAVRRDLLRLNDGKRTAAWLTDGERVLRSVADLGSYATRIERLEASAEAFLQKENLALLPHAVSHRAVRAEILVAVAEFTSEPLDRPASKLIDAFDSALHKQCGGSALRKRI